MISLGGLVGILIVSILIGKRTIDPKKSVYVTLAALALVQVLVVLIQMLTTKVPTQ